MKPLYFSIIFTCLLSACLQAEAPFVPFSSTKPPLLADGWEISPPQEQQIDEQALTRFYESLHEDESLFALRSMLVFRNGKLVAESYLKDESDRTIPRPVWSCTKQIVGILSGIALERGIIRSLDDPISEYIDADWTQHADKKEISIRQSLTMRSGIDFDEQKDVSKLLQRSPSNTLEYILDLPMRTTEAPDYYYNSGDPHLAAAAIQQETGKTLVEWGEEVLFREMGLTQYTWLTYDGLNFGGYGISTTPRELGKIAQLVLNKGDWNGNQIVGQDWINEMTSFQSSTGADSEYEFGYLWWINPSENLIFMAGSGGQYACIDREKQLIVVMMSEHDTDGDLEINFETCIRLVNQIRATLQ